MATSTVGISGNIDVNKALRGLLGSERVTGSATIPKVVDRTAIHYDTTEAWNSMTPYVGLEGHIYIYSDYTTRDNGDGTTTTIPALKVGDGQTYLIDLPFTFVGDAQAFVNHMAEASIHVSTSDRNSWDAKVIPHVSDDVLYFVN